MQEQEPSSRNAYRVFGVVYLVLGLPSFWALVTGQLERGGNAYFALSFLGVPLGVLLLVFGLGRARQSNLSDIAVRVAGAGLLNAVFMLGSKVVMDRYHAGFETAYRFFGVVVFFLATVSMMALIAALARNRSGEP